MWQISTESQVYMRDSQRLCFLQESSILRGSLKGQQTKQGSRQNTYKMGNGREEASRCLSGPKHAVTFQGSTSAVKGTPFLYIWAIP
jgi:hypothetical protein